MKAFSIKLNNGQEFIIGETYKGKCDATGEVITDEFWGFNYSMDLFEFECHFCSEIYQNEKIEKDEKDKDQLSLF